MIRRLQFGEAALAKEVAELHCRHIEGGVLGILGPRFLGTLYRYIADSSGSAVWVDVDEGALRGFICGCRDDKAMFSAVLRRGFPRLALAGIASMGRRGVMYGILSTIRVLVGPSVGTDQPRAQLLSIAVSEAHRRKNVASGLVGQLHQQFALWNVNRALVWTTESNSPALGLYESHGYRRSFSVQHSPEDMVGLTRDFE